MKEYVGMNKIRKILCLILTVTMLLSITGCSKSSTGTNSLNDMITITDQGGNVVKVPGHINRIVVCDILPLPSVLAVFFDSAKKIVGMAQPSMTAAKNSLLSKLYPEILNAKTGFINGSDVNVEELTALKPDVVFYSASSKELGDKLRKAGFNAVAISVNKWNYNAIETLNNWIALLSQIFPDNDKSKIVKDYSDKTYELVQKRVAKLPENEKTKLFFLFKYSENSISTSGNQFFGEWWAEAIGAVNIGKEINKDNAVQVNMEQIYKWNPDKILITNFTTAQPEDLYNNSTGSYNWSGIKAVENKQVYKMPLGMYRSYTPGVDTPITLLWMAKTVYPDLFKDINITDEVKKYYKTVFGINLTDQQANSIFTPVSDAGVGF
jgi:iron complex transport system substrate-binding protein